jgi:hypothetical protein
MEKQMTHKDYMEMIPFYLYDELKGDEKLLLEKHLETCTGCKKEVEVYKRLFSEISVDAKEIANENLLNDARQELKKTIYQELSRRTLPQNIFEAILSFLTKPAGLAFSVTSVLFVGLFIGYLIFRNPDPVGFTPLNGDQIVNSNNYRNLRISNIKFVDSDLSNGEVEFSYDVTKREHLKGNVNSPDVQNILTYAILNEQNPGVRLNSINVISTNQNNKVDAELKQTLCTVAKYDDNPGVRREALKFLREIPFDSDVKSTLLYVLLNDTSAGLRIEAINLLSDASKQGSIFNNQDLSIFKEKVQKDQNNYIKFQAKNIIKEY